ncbi:glycosyltransferase family 39 protein, partial [bacterium]|nr:glycosyltransferase family 39 protein [bacterium]
MSQIPDNTTLLWRRWAGPLVIALCAAAMIRLTWGAWPDVLIDFGRELYVPWRLAEGEVLFRDVVHFNGPISPYFNALLFRLFGVGLRTVIAGNFVLLVALLTLLYRLLAGAARRPSATLGCCAIVALCAFGQYSLVGNGNYLTPYSHEMTHGILLCLAAVAAVGRYARTRRLRWAALAGLAVGLAFLTKAEVFLAGFGAAVAGVAAVQWRERRRHVRAFGMLALGMLVAPVLSFLLLRTALPEAEALGGTLGSWRYVFRSDITALDYYRRIIGTLDIGESLRLMGMWSLAYVGLFGGAFVLAWMGAAKRYWLALAALTGVGAVLHGNALAIRWQDALYPLPLVMAAGVAVTGRRVLRQDGDRAIIQFTLFVFALALMLKIILRSCVYHYGFGLAMPALALFVILLVDWAPAWLNRRGKGGIVFLAVSVAVLGVGGVFHLRVIDSWLSRKTVVVGAGPDRFVADAGRALAVNQALALLEEWVGEDQTFVVFPEGVMLNFLTRRRSPTRYIKFVPPEMLMFGEAAMLEAFQANPPD